MVTIQKLSLKRRVVIYRRQHSLVQNSRGIPDGSSACSCQWLHKASPFTADISGNVRSATRMAQVADRLAWQSGSVAEPSFVLGLVKWKVDQSQCGTGYDKGPESCYNPKIGQGSLRMALSAERKLLLIIFTNEYREKCSCQLCACTACAKR